MSIRPPPLAPLASRRAPAKVTVLPLVFTDPPVVPATLIVPLTCTAPLPSNVTSPPLRVIEPASMLPLMLTAPVSNVLTAFAVRITRPPSA
ncbi:hypothetical protein [Chromatium okenii]|uniref:hypothetical protein n=1 Tax=Chromatium okenii TaxID=61644 RepID=UPI001F5BC179|nr:hypothetical protein [Chromatium okenii]